MRVLFVSGELIAGDLAYRLKLEGCEVKLLVLQKLKEISWKKESFLADGWNVSFLNNVYDKNFGIDRRF